MSTDVHSTDSRNPEGQTVTSDPISRRTSPIPLSNISALTSSAIDDIPPDDSSILESNVGHFARSDLSEVPDSFMRGNSARSSKPTYPYEIPLQTLGGAAAGTERSPRHVRINVLWFSSLVFSLVSASIGILTKQWLREYTSGAASSPRENARIRQFRHEGFVSWRIPETIALLPILLQIALVLFFVGLLDLLWSLHPVVAGVGWREREKAIVRSSEPHLDHHILAGADATFMDDEFLENTVRPCINDTDCTAALNCLYEILDHRADSIVDGVPHWKHCEDVDGGINMLLHLVVDILPRIDPTNEACIIRTLTISDKLCRAIPFESCHTETQILYQRLFDILSRFLSLPQSVQKTAFDLMRRLYHRSETAVRPAVIQRIISYARCARIDSRHDMFHMACGMAIGFSIAPNLSASAFNSVRDQLRNMLEDLEGYIATPAPETVQSGPYLSLLLALVELWRRDSDLVSERLLRMIDKVVTGEGEADSTAGENLGELGLRKAE
ncbi:hypothetical protein A0H81_06409 [Grifola frondosa]|uniref:DUF6535 domain-containing protein n=1 Tax=Grifola frondosa TaxID=5627 RepID=A0A1C7M9Q3_GRIFR|nr:hypothetical protein A0H81_06409 [Grifola frondosa]